MSNPQDSAPPSQLSADQLQKEIDFRRKEINTASYSMSVGELVNLYRDGDLEIYPEFQRLFRWTPKQKSRFIESLLLGIPIPSIFVHQRQDGIWDVVDGVQRLSTILEFQGVLRNAGQELEPASKLEGTDYLPSLHDIVWSKEQGSPHLTPEQQRLIKRASMDIKIVTRESDETAKFDLFQRLNTGGSQLSDQEMRNSLLVMTNADYFRWMSQLSETTAFQDSVGLSDKNLNEKYDMELVLRFLLLKDLGDNELRSIGDLSDFLTEESVKYARHHPEDTERNENEFHAVFELIEEAAEDRSFRRYDSAKKRFSGGFSVSGFEAVTLGIQQNLEFWREMPRDEAAQSLQERIQQLWERAEFRENSGQGVRANTRISRIVPFAREFFRP